MTVPIKDVALLPAEVEEDSQKVLLESYRSSARLNGMRADGLQGESAHLRHQISLIHRSLSWRVTMPLRAVRSLSLGRLPSGRPLKELPEGFLPFGKKVASKRSAGRLKSAFPFGLG